VRLAFAVAAHLESEILLVDEVLAVGDAEFQKKCLGKMGDVATNEGRTVLFVSHNMGAVQSLCMRVIWLNGGGLFFDAATAETIFHYMQRKGELVENDLSNRQDRAGSGKSKVVNISIQNFENPPSPLLTVGKPVRFIIRVSNNMSGLSCAFTIYDHLGQPITAFDSINPAPNDCPNHIINNEFICDIDELAIAPGFYTMNVALRSQGELQDHVESAVRFSIEEGFFNGRRVKKNDFIRSVLKHTWKTPSNGV